MRGSSRGPTTTVTHSSQLSSGRVIGGIVAVLLGWLFGWLVVLIAWIWVINWRYPGGWGNAIGIGLIGWLSVVVITYALAVLNVLKFTALGIPAV